MSDATEAIIVFAGCDASVSLRVIISERLLASLQGLADAVAKAGDDIACAPTLKIVLPSDVEDWDWENNHTPVWDVARQTMSNPYAPYDEPPVAAKPPTSDWFDI